MIFQLKLKFHFHLKSTRFISSFAKHSITHYNHLSNFLGGVRVAQQKKLIKYTYNPSSTFLRRNVEFLVQQGYFFSFTEAPFSSSFSRSSKRPQLYTRSITVWLKYQVNSLPLVSNLKCYYKVRSPCTLSYKKVLQLSRRSFELHVLSTSRGIRDAKFCALNRLGGVLLYSIS